MTPPTLRPLTSLPPRELGRVKDFDLALAKYGAAKVQPLLDGMLTSDTFADRVVEDLRKVPGGRALYAQAVEEGIDAVPEAPESMKQLFAEMEHVPDWVDWEQLRRASIAYFRAGPLVSFVFTCASIAGGDQAYGLTRPQVFTGRFREKAYIRSSETVRWLVAAAKPDGMRRDSDGFKLTAHVRLLHAYVRWGAIRSKKWDWDDWGMPICDTDCAVVIAYSFAGVYIDALIKTGFRFDEQDLEDLGAIGDKKLAGASYADPGRKQ